MSEPCKHERYGLSGANVIINNLTAEIERVDVYLADSLEREKVLTAKLMRVVSLCDKADEFGQDVPVAFLRVTMKVA